MKGSRTRYLIDLTLEDRLHWKVSGLLIIYSLRETTIPNSVQFLSSKSDKIFHSYTLSL